MVFLLAALPYSTMPNTSASAIQVAWLIFFLCSSCCSECSFCQISGTKEWPWRAGGAGWWREGVSLADPACALLPPVVLLCSPLVTISEDLTLVPAPSCLLCFSQAQPSATDIQAKKWGWWPAGGCYCKVPKSWTDGSDSGDKFEWSYRWQLLSHR